VQGDGTEDDQGGDHEREDEGEHRARIYRGGPAGACCESGPRRVRLPCPMPRTLEPAMSRLVAVTIAVTIAVTLAACGGSDTAVTAPGLGELCPESRRA
jgi:hypothetical protein